MYQEKEAYRKGFSEQSDSYEKTSPSKIAQSTIKEI